MTPRNTLRLIAAATAALIPATLSAQFAAGDQALVSVQWLQQHQHDRDLVLLQIGPVPGFQAQHIAGTRFVDMHEVSSPMKAGTLSLEMLPEPELLRSLEKLGVSDNSRIVIVFDSGWVSPATRVLYTLGYAGLANHAALLDGGLDAWRAKGLPVTAVVEPAAPGHLTTHILPALIVDNEYVSSHRSAAHAKVIDARAPEFYAGTAHGVMSAGHVPGAVNIPFDAMTDSTDHLLSRSAIDAKFRAAGVAPGDTVIAYCHVGQQATLLLFGAAYTGHPARLYDGSFQDWSMRKLPTEGGKP